MAGKDQHNGKTVFMLPGIYNETLALLAETHDYFYREAKHEQQDMDNRLRTMFSSEMSRMTIRLSCIMAWLMARKAVFSGQLSAEEANTHYRLDCRDICLNQHIEAESILPDRMTDLLDKTYELYQRVARLDDLNEKPEAGVS